MLRQDCNISPLAGAQDQAQKGDQGPDTDLNWLGRAMVTENRAPACVVVTWEGRQCNSKCTSPPLSYPLLDNLSMMPHGLGYHLGQLGSDVLVVSPFNCVCCPSLCGDVVGWGAQRPWLCYQPSVQHKGKTQPHTSQLLCTILAPSQPEPAQ